MLLWNTVDRSRQRIARSSFSSSSRRFRPSKTISPLLTRAGPWRAVLFAALFCAGAYLFPMQDEMRFGQVDAVLAALAVADCAAVKPRWPRGALVGLATAVKLVPGVFIVYLWVSGRRRAARTATLAALAWTLIIATFRVFRTDGGSPLVYLVAGAIIVVLVLLAWRWDTAVMRRALARRSASSVISSSIRLSFAG